MPSALSACGRGRIAACAEVKRRSRTVIADGNVTIGTSVRSRAVLSFRKGNVIPTGTDFATGRDNLPAGFNQ